MHTAPDMTDYLVRKTSTLSCAVVGCYSNGNKLRYSFNPPHIQYLYLVILKKFQFSQSFLARFKSLELLNGIIMYVELSRKHSDILFKDYYFTPKEEMHILYIHRHQR